MPKYSPSRFATIAILSSISAFSALSAGCSGKQTTASPKATAVSDAHAGPVLLTEAATARRETVRRSALLSGQVEPFKIATLSAEAAEVIRQRPVLRGDRVTQGQVVAALEDRTARAALDRALAAAQQATAARQQAESEYRRAATETEAARGQARAALLLAQAGEQKARSFTRTQELREAEAALDQTRTDENLARLEADRYRKLVAEGALAQQVLDRAQAAYDAAAARRRAAEQRVSLAREGARQEDIAAATAQVRSAESGVLAADARPDRLAALHAQIAALRAQEAGAQAAVRQARIDLGKHTVRAPFSGRVLETLAEVGERTAPGTPLLRIGSTDQVKMTFSLPEAQRAGLHPGQQVKTTADAVPGRSFTGTIRALGTQADLRTRTFPIEVTIANPGERLLPGMVARLDLTTGGPAEQRVSVPVAAVAAEGERTYVFLLQEGRAQRRDVVLGSPLGATRVLVRSGLSGGEQIAATPQRLTDGARVQVATGTTAANMIPEEEAAQP